MDINNFTPLPDTLKEDISNPKKVSTRHFKIPDVMLLASFLIFVLSAGYWVQSTMLQPSTSATQKIIEITLTPTPSPTLTLPGEGNLEEVTVEPVEEEVPIEDPPPEKELSE